MSYGLLNPLGSFMQQGQMHGAQLSQAPQRSPNPVDLAQFAQSAQVNLPAAAASAAPAAAPSVIPGYGISRPEMDFALFTGLSGQELQQALGMSAHSILNYRLSGNVDRQERQMESLPYRAQQGLLGDLAMGVQQQVARDPRITLRDAIAAALRS